MNAFERPSYDMALRPEHLDIISLCTGGGGPTMRTEEQKARYNAREREKRQENPEYAEKRRAALRAARDPESDAERCRKYREANRERLAKQKREHYQRVRKASDKTEEGRFKDREKKSRRRAVYSEGTITPEQWQEICIRHDNRCAYCAAKPDVLEMDHVLAISKGGAHSASNIVPACKPCNSAKGAR
jgi:5-methylcytosine-specific restriction endonuclease McrA